MKKILCLAAGLLAFNLTPGLAQPAPAPNSAIFQNRLRSIVNAANTHAITLNPAGQTMAVDPATGLPFDSKPLTKFSLDFPGGTPAQLVKAIEKAMDKPLNVIINQEDENTKLPPLKMNDVYLPQLFTALEVASQKMVAYNNRPGMPGSYSQMSTGYGFKSADAMSDTAVWYFHVEKPSLPPEEVPVQKICQYYSLSTYLDRGFTVDDITTAIQTGWKMSGDTSPPELNYHKETKLLMAYGEASKLNTINQVLQTLPSVKEEFWRQAIDRMNRLQIQIDQLKQQPPAAVPATSNSPVEKSGK